MGALKQKQQYVESLSKTIEESNGIYLADSTGITANKINDLRKQCREAGVKYTIAKNTLAKRAFNKAGISSFDNELKGPTSIIMIKGDGVTPAKILSDFANVRANQDKFTLKGSMVDGAFFDASDTKRLATIPNREVLLSQLLSVMNAPMRNLAGVLGSILRQVPSVIQEVAKQKESKN